MGPGSGLSREDWTGSYRRVIDACAKLPCKAALTDGEIIVRDENGISDFNALRSAIHKAQHRIVFFALDLVHLNDRDFRRTPLLERRAASEPAMPMEYRCRQPRCQKGSPLKLPPRPLGQANDPSRPGARRRALLRWSAAKGDGLFEPLHFGKFAIRGENPDGERLAVAGGAETQRVAGAVLRLDIFEAIVGDDQLRLRAIDGIDRHDVRNQLRVRPRGGLMPLAGRRFKRPKSAEQTVKGPEALSG
jgi:hypothetical protein